MHISIFLLAIASLFSGSSALKGSRTTPDTPSPIDLQRRGPTGINNQGSGYCAKGSMSELVGFVEQIPAYQQYKDGEHIACSGIKSSLALGGGTCVYFQGTGINHLGIEAQRLIQILSQHPNTQGCGSIPVSLLPELGSVNQFSAAGMLTVNYVANTDNPCPPGVCGATTC